MTNSKHTIEVSIVLVDNLGYPLELGYGYYRQQLANSTNISIPLWVYSGLTRGCEFLELEESHAPGSSGILWDDEVRKALEYTRSRHSLQETECLNGGS